MYVSAKKRLLVLGKKTSPLKVKVENVIAALLPHGEMHFDAVAVQLGMSGRTLARKLALEGHSFTEILEDLRLALARRYLAESEMSISEIAWLLGYSEVANFTHAFHRWTGTNPRTARAKARRSIEYKARKSGLRHCPAPLVAKKVACLSAPKSAVGKADIPSAVC